MPVEHTIHKIDINSERTGLYLCESMALSVQITLFGLDTPPILNKGQNKDFRALVFEMYLRQELFRGSNDFKRHNLFIFGFLHRLGRAGYTNVRVGRPNYNLLEICIFSLETLKTLKYNVRHSINFFH